MRIFGGRRPELEGLQRRIAALEALVAQLAGQANIPVPAPSLTPQGTLYSAPSPEVRRAVEQGNKVAAIKMLREEQPQLTLREAKEIVERL